MGKISRLCRDYIGVSREYADILYRACSPDSLLTTSKLTSMAGLFSPII